MPYRNLIRNPRLIALALILGWNFSLVVFRLKITGGISFFCFIWNLFLAVVPYGCAEAALYFSKRKYRAAPFFLTGIAVLFLPNSPYVITDLFHLRSRAEMPFWYDTLLLFSLALSGLVLFYATIFRIREVLIRYWGWLAAECSVVFLSFLCAFGIYLGRYLRFNSWDVVSNPDDLAGAIADRFLNPFMHPQTMGVTLLYGVFMLTGYWVIRLYHMGQDRNLPVNAAMV